MQAALHRNIYLANPEYVKLIVCVHLTAFVRSIRRAQLNQIKVLQLGIDAACNQLGNMRFPLSL